MPKLVESLFDIVYTILVPTVMPYRWTNIVRTLEKTINVRTALDCFESGP